MVKNDIWLELAKRGINVYDMIDPQLVAEHLPEFVEYLQNTLQSCLCNDSGTIQIAVGTAFRVLPNINHTGMNQFHTVTCLFRLIGNKGQKSGNRKQKIFYSV